MGLFFAIKKKKILSVLTVCSFIYILLPFCFFVFVTVLVEN